MKKILVAEDDLYINNLLCDLLGRQGYDPVAAFSGTEAMMCLPLHDFSLILLDLMLPGKSGEEVLAGIRKTSSVPVIVLTAVTDKETTIKLLRMGADDYLGKPFDNGELLARVEVCLRRSEAAPSGAARFVYKDITLDDERFDAFVGGQHAMLSKREFEILRLLMSHPKKVFTKNNIYESVWGGEFLGDDNTINVHISKLRAKLASVGTDAEYIQTVWGIGFKMS